MSWAFGVHAVEALISDAPESVQEVWLVKSRKPGPARERVRQRAEEAGIRFRLVDDQQMRKVAADGRHQGVAARVSEFAYADAEALLQEEGAGMIVVLDEVQDPHNLGAILRTAAAFGARGVVIPRHRSASVTPVVRKVAVGAEGRVAVAQVTNLARFLESAAAAGYWSYALSADGEGELGVVTPSERCVWVLGSEGRGVRRNVRAKCDASVSIPMGQMESLNVSVAAGIAMWSWVRSRGAK